VKKGLLLPRKPQRNRGRDRNFIGWFVCLLSHAARLMLFWDESQQNNAVVLIADRDEGLAACAASRRVYVIDLSQIRTFLLTIPRNRPFVRVRLLLRMGCTLCLGMCPLTGPYRRSPRDHITTTMTSRTPGCNGSNMLCVNGGGSSEKEE
jgi:hypothetical protein